MKVLIQFPSGEEMELDEAVESTQPAEDRSGTDRFIEWEAERSLCQTIGDLQNTTHHA